MGKLVIDDKTTPQPPKPSVPKPALFLKPLKLVGVARVPKGYVAVTVELDVDGKVVAIKQGIAQTFPEYVTGEAKRILGALVLK